MGRLILVGVGMWAMGAGVGVVQAGQVGELDDSGWLGEGRQAQQAPRLALAPAPAPLGEAGKGGGDGLSPSGQPLA